MLTQLDGTDNVVAFLIEGHVIKDDIERAVRLLDAAFERDGPVHLFVELHDFQGMAFDAWIGDLGHGLRYVTRLKRFGRVAIVSGQPWIRVASRFESALLPFITYEVFTPDKRDHALAWVKGEASPPHPPSLRMVSQDQDAIFAFELDGRITRTDIDLMHRHLTHALEAGRPLHVLGRIRRYDGFEPDILVHRTYFELKFALVKHIARYAIVGGPDWFDWGIHIATPLLPMKLRQFPVDEEDAARAWLLEEFASSG